METIHFPVAADEARADMADAGARSAQVADGRLHAAAARLTGGLSPISLALATADWWLHLATQPAQSARLAADAQQRAWRWWSETLAGDAAIAPDPRFRAEGWQAWPYHAIARAWQSAEAWWTQAAQLRGMSHHHQDMTRFFARQWMDMLSPSNAGLANPEVAARTRERAGANLLEGAVHALDRWRTQQGLPPLQPTEQDWAPGRTLALTPGRVVHRNHLVELIQYEPSTHQVQAEPVFIVPSWIMKYYILDLQPHNSLVRWLVGQGHTVFILSWRNPDESDALLSMEDYLQLGVLDSLAAIARLVPGEPVHACGYCLGGTLLSIAAAALSRPARVRGAEQLPPLATVTLLAAETDFSEPGEMGVLIDESQVAMIEDLMAERGYLTGPQMADSFAYLHSRELIWSQRVREFWLGESTVPNDLMAWNADVTRMPALMHSEYLRRCYLRNELAQGAYPVEGRPVALGDIRQPMFVVATETDHVSPWRSVFKIHQLADTDIDFVLTSGGHNAGIVSEPGHPNRHHARLLTPADAPRPTPDGWVEAATRHEGSWWPAWHGWLIEHGRGARVSARHPVTVEGLPAAPGEHVLMRYRD